MKRILPFTREHEMFRASVSRFVDKEIVPYYEQWEQDGIIPRELYKKMGDQGYLLAWADEKYGGGGGDLLYSVIVGEEVCSKGCMGVFVYLHDMVVAPYIDSFGNEEQKMRWLPDCASGEKILALAMTEPDAGSDLTAMRTRAVKDGDSYILNGSKTFISNGLLADLVIVAAKTDPQAGHRGISLFVVENGTPGFIKGRKIPKIGLHCQDTCELFFEDCRIPADNLLGKEGQGFFYLMQKLQPERLCGLLSVAAAQRCLDITIEYVKQRQLFGKPLSSFQNTQFVLAEIAAEIEIGRSYSDQLLLAHMHGEKILKEVSIGKFWLTEMFSRVASRCLQLFGGYGYCQEYEISRLFTDARVQMIYAGANEVMKVIIAKELGL